MHCAYVCFVIIKLCHYRNQCSKSSHNLHTISLCRCIIIKSDLCQLIMLSFVHSVNAETQYILELKKNHNQCIKYKLIYSLTISARVEIDLTPNRSMAAVRKLYFRSIGVVVRSKRKQTICAGNIHRRVFIPATPCSALPCSALCSVGML